MSIITPIAPRPTQPARAAPHAVVIGSGFGGLAAAIRLGARGYRVTVLERLPEPGGRASVFRQDGFTFDAGPTIITAPFLLEELWALCGRRMEDDIELRPMDPFYRIRFQDGAVFNYNGDEGAMAAEIARFAPDDLAGYQRFMRESEAIYRVGFERLGDVPFSDWTSMARVAPDLVRLGAWRSVHQMVARYVRDERLRVVLSFHPLLVGGNPFTASAIYSLIAFLERRWGVHFAMGGTGRLVQKLAGLIQGQGNVLRCGAEVAEIVVERGAATGVRLTGGEVLPADLVVSNTTRSCWAPAIASCWPTSSSGTSWPRISASTCIARPRRTQASRRRAAMPSTCSRRCRTWRAGSIGRRRRSRIAGRSRPSWGGLSCRG